MTFTRLVALMGLCLGLRVFNPALSGVIFYAGLYIMLFVSADSTFRRMHDEGVVLKWIVLMINCLAGLYCVTNIVNLLKG